MLSFPLSALTYMVLTPCDNYHQREHYLCHSLLPITILPNLHSEISTAMMKFSVCLKISSLVLVYKCGQKKLNNLYYQVKEQRRCSTWQKTKNLIHRSLNSRLWICIIPGNILIHSWNASMAYVGVS